MKIINLGIWEYRKAEAFQKELHQKRTRNEIEDTLIFTTHPPVITLGKNGKRENLRVGLENLLEMGISFYRVERGGDITYHGYGQLMIYPIFLIKRGIGGMRRFIEKWEEVILHSLRSFGIEGHTKSGYPGVYVENKKIASFGFALKERVTYHGIALNVKDDLSPFSLIYPCGQRDLEMTAMESILKKEIEIDAVRERIVEVLLERTPDD